MKKICSVCKCEFENRASDCCSSDCSAETIEIIISKNGVQFKPYHIESTK